jgi:hypothetical protein
LPADPAHFANFLAEATAGAHGHTQTKQRACAIRALSKLVGVPSPVGDPLVCDVRAGIRRTHKDTRGRACPIFSYELQAADAFPPFSGAGAAGSTGWGPVRQCPPYPFGNGLGPRPYGARPRLKPQRSASTISARAKCQPRPSLHSRPDSVDPVWIARLAAAWKRPPLGQPIFALWPLLSTPSGCRCTAFPSTASGSTAARRRRAEAQRRADMDLRASRREC